jgi:hypothetical protein
MGGTKRRTAGESGQRNWYKKDSDIKLIRVLRVDQGKRSWFWSEKDNDSYNEVPPENRELR